MRPRGPRAATVLIGLVAVLATSCGNKSASAADIVRAAPAKTAAAGLARVAINVSFSAGGNPSTVTGDGVIDLKNRRGAISLDLGALGGSFGVSTVETFLSSDGIFVKLPPSVLPGSRPWLKLDLATLATQAGINLGSLGQIQSADPSQALEFLKGAVDDMGKLGEENVRGASTTHYHGTLDLQKAAAQVADDARPAVNEAIAALGTATVPVDVWIDAQGRMRRMRLTVDPDGEGPTPPGTIEFEMYDFGVKADIQPPPADQITDLSQVFGGLPRS